MVAAVTVRHPGGRFAIEEIELDDPRSGEVQVRMVATGICHTDIKMAGEEGALPFPVVLGHEGAGVVAVVGEGVDRVAVGDHVVLSYASCGRCPNCNEGRPFYCDDIAGQNFRCARDDGSTAFRQGGAAVHSHFFGQSSFAARANVEARCVLRVDPDLPLERLGPLGCGIQTGAGSVLNVFKAEPGSSIAVFGAGAVGLSAVMAAAAAGATMIVAVDVHDTRLEMALELGATHVVHAARERSDAAILRFAPRGVDFSLDTTGSADIIGQACTVLRTLGTCGLLTSTQDVALSPRTMLRKGLRLQGICEGESDPAVFIPQLIDLHRAGRFPFDKLLSFYPVSEIERAIADARSGVAIKPVLRFL